MYQMFSEKSLKKIKLIKNKQNASTPFIRAVLDSSLIHTQLRNLQGLPN